MGTFSVIRRPLRDESSLALVRGIVSPLLRRTDAAIAEMHRYRGGMRFSDLSEREPANEYAHTLMHLTNARGNLQDMCNGFVDMADDYVIDTAMVALTTAHTIIGRAKAAMEAVRRSEQEFFARVYAGKLLVALSEEQTKGFETYCAQRRQEADYWGYHS